jgi:hypothetical protein
LLSCHADIKFNNMYLIKRITPRYAIVKCTGNKETYKL